MELKLGFMKKRSRSFNVRKSCCKKSIVFIFVVAIFTILGIVLCFSRYHLGNLNILVPQQTIDKNVVSIYNDFKGSHPHNNEENKHVILNNVMLLDEIDDAHFSGSKAWRELKAALDLSTHVSNVNDNAITVILPQQVCPSSIFMAAKDFKKTSQSSIIPLPCSLGVGSTITMIGSPKRAHKTLNSLTFKTDEVSRFQVEVQGFKQKKDEKYPPLVLHINPRLSGDWSSKPIIEHNIRHDQDQWGVALRCEGEENKDKVDDFLKCEKWLQVKGDQESSIFDKEYWLSEKDSHFEDQTREMTYPFVEGQEFTFTIFAGVEGFHTAINNHHISSFPYEEGYSLQTASGIAVGGDVDLVSVNVTSLPQEDVWKKLSTPTKEIELFVGITSASDNFARRMAIRKTWFQSKSIQSVLVVPRFFIALNKNQDTNLQLQKEADFYGDIIISPYIDHYDILVLKTLEIFKFGVRNVKAKYIMKCDDDTFVRLESILEEIKAKDISQGLYMGNMNVGHLPLRSGKWGVTVQEWPDELQYPTYANGPGYILSNDIANFIVDKNEKGQLPLFKMEDVSTGLWVERFAREHDYRVHYEDNKQFAQAWCENNYLTVHNQSPHQIACLWEKLVASKGKGGCCYF